MKHKFDIWTRNPANSSKVGYLSHHIEMSEEELEEAALELFKRTHSIDEGYEYEARLDETII